MASKEAEKFIRILASQLSEAGLKDLSDDLLKDALLKSLSAFPGGNLREELEGSFDKYFQKLKSSQTPHSTRAGARKRKRQAQQVPESEEETKGEVGGEEEGEEGEVSRWSVNVLTGRGLEDSLAAVKESADSIQQEAYQKLVVALQGDENSLSQVLQQWSEGLANSPPSVCFEAVRLCSQVADNPHCFVPWMKFSFRVYSHLAERGSGSRSEVSADELGKLGESILSFLTQAHLMHSHLNAEQESYEDLIAAILSLYIDTLSLSASRDNVSANCSSEHLMCVLHTLLGHSTEHCVDAVLQTSSAPSVASSHLLLPLFRKVLSQHIGTQITPAHYIKCVCSFHHAVALASAVGKPSTPLQTLVHRVPVPADLREWLWKRNPSACERLGLKHSWSQERVVRHVMKKKLKREQVEELLDLASGITTEAHAMVVGSDDEEQCTQDREICQQLFFFDEEGQSPKKTDTCDRSSPEVDDTMEEPSSPEQMDQDTPSFGVGTPCEKPGRSALSEGPDRPLFFVGHEMESHVYVSKGLTQVKTQCSHMESPHGQIGLSEVAEGSNVFQSLDSINPTIRGSARKTNKQHEASTTKKNTRGRYSSTKKNPTGSRYSSTKKPPTGGRYSSTKKTPTGSRYSSTKKTPTGGRYASTTQPHTGSRYSSMATDHDYTPMLLRSSSRKKAPKISATATKHLRGQREELNCEFATDY